MNWIKHYVVLNSCREVSALHPEESPLSQLAMEVDLAMPAPTQGIVVDLRKSAHLAVTMESQCLMFMQD